MRFLNTDGLSYTDINIVSFTPQIDINYTLVEKSDRSYVSIDRGEITDRYQCEMVFRGSMEYINSVVKELVSLRRDKKDVIIDQFESNVFGENVDHSGSVSALVFSMQEQRSPVVNVHEVRISFLATDITTTGGVGIPSSVSCLQDDWTGTSQWNATISETYTGNNTFADRERDKYVFSGDYIMSLSETSEILNFWKTQRGESFVINDGDFGISYMFGADGGGNGSHTVVMQNVSYGNTSSPVVRMVKINLIKVG